MLKEKAVKEIIIKKDSGVKRKGCKKMLKLIMIKIKIMIMIMIRIKITELINY